MGTRLLHTIDISADAGRVFDCVSTPAFWPDWHPSSLRLHGDAARPLLANDGFEEDVRAAGREAHLRWTVLLADAPHLWRARAVADNGAELELTYRLRSTLSGVQFERELHYRLPGVWLNLLNVLLIRRRIAAESLHSLQQLKAVLELPASSRYSLSPK